MTILPQDNQNDQILNDTISWFFKKFNVSSLLRSCNGEKSKGFSAMQILRYLVCLVFSDRSMYRQIVTGSYKEEFSKNAVYRFYNSVKTNWLRLTTMLSAKVINSYLRPLTSEER